MKKNNYKGKFVVFEGLDGSGQTTQAQLLEEYLKNKNYQVILTKEPTLNSLAGKKIRKILDKKIQLKPEQLQKLFSRDRETHLKKVIIPALKKGETVISDRYFFSSFAYGAASGLDLDWLIKINDKFLMPDLTFILRVKPEVCVKRIEKRGIAKTLFEKKEKLTNVWKIYKILPKKFSILAKNYTESSKTLRKKRKDIIIINGEKNPKEVFSFVLKKYKEILLK